MRADVLSVTSHPRSSCPAPLLCCWPLLTTLFSPLTALLALLPRQFANRHSLSFRFIGRSLSFWPEQSQASPLRNGNYYTPKKLKCWTFPVFPAHLSTLIRDAQQTGGGSSPEGLRERWFAALQRGLSLLQTQTSSPNEELLTAVGGWYKMIDWGLPGESTSGSLHCSSSEVILRVFV